MDKFIGIENVVKGLGRCSHNGLAVFTSRGNDEVFRRYQLEGETMDDVNDAFIDWLNDLEQQNPGSFVNYKVQLYEFPEGAKRRKGCGVISFQLNETPNKEHFKTKTNMVGGDFVHKDTMLLAIENANLKNKNEALENRLEALEAKILGFDDDDEDEETEQESFIGSLNEALKDKMPALIDVVIGMITKQTTAPAINGIGDINDLIAEFKQINPNIESDLHKLLQLAKTKPDLFKMLIQQLRAM
jgi:hypothetical protein